MSVLDEFMQDYVNQHPDDTRHELTISGLKSFSYNEQLVAALRRTHSSEVEYGYGNFWLTAARLEHLANVQNLLKRDFPDRCYMAVDFYVDGGVAQLYTQFSGGITARTARSKVDFVTGLIRSVAGMIAVPEAVCESVRTKVAKMLTLTSVKPKRVYAPRVQIAKKKDARNIKASKKT